MEVSLPPWWWAGAGILYRWGNWGLAIRNQGHASWISWSQQKKRMDVGEWGAWGQVSHSFVTCLPRNHDMGSMLGAQRIGTKPGTSPSSSCQPHSWCLHLQAWPLRAWTRSMASQESGSTALHWFTQTRRPNTVTGLLPMWRKGTVLTRLWLNKETTRLFLPRSRTFLLIFLWNFFH